MEIGRLVDALEREGAALAGAAEKAGLDAAVPTCPEWTVRDLVRHTGYVHRWAASYVRDARVAMLNDDEEDAVVGPLPDDVGLLAWFREGHAALVATLRTAPADVTCWHFLTAPSPLAFWARRQAHETTIHRSDAEAATGEITGVPRGFALDGIDELLLGFYARRGGRLRSDVPRRLLVRATDVSGTTAPATDVPGVRVPATDVSGTTAPGTDVPGATAPATHVSGTTAPAVDVPGATAPAIDVIGTEAPATAWTIEIGPDGATPNRGEGDADCVLRGPASDLYLALWNRRSTDDLDVEGDRSVLDLWRERATVRWT